MIELRTGVPGSGKTLSMVEVLAKLFKRWDVHPEEARPVFVSGIPDLIFPVSEMPLKSVQINRAGSPSLVPDWDAMPSGSLVLIDECQGVFPPRSSASVTPAHVAWLNTHRHHGFDIWLTTQNPKLIDVSVRALVGKHQHYRRLFGGSRAAVYEWDACSDNLSGMKQAVIKYWAYPKRAFTFYKSAELHTKQTFRLPRWLLIPVVGVALGLFFVPRAFSVVSQGISGKGVSTVPQPVVPVKADLPMVSAVQAAPTQAGALAPVKEAQIMDFNKPFTNEAPPDRPVSKLKLAHGVYSDMPEDRQHYSDDELKVQARSARVLALMEQQKIYNASLAVAEMNQNIPVTFPISINGANPQR